MELWLGVLAAVLALAAAAGVLLRLARRIQPRRGPAGRHEFTIVVQGRYRPDRVAVTQGDRVRLRFRRLEDDPCSERVVFSGINLERRLPAFQETLIEFVPPVAGEHLFTCKWGMYRGKLLVRPRAKRRR
jgi:plastocyanin domain-containing protein